MIPESNYHVRDREQQGNAKQPISICEKRRFYFGELYTVSRIKYICKFAYYATGLMRRESPLEPGVLDYSKVAFTSDHDGNDDIFVMNPDGSNVKKLTTDPV